VRQLLRCVPLALVLLASCAASRPTHAPLAVLRPVDLTLNVEPTLAPLQLADGMSAEAADGVALELSLYAVKPSALEALSEERGSSPVCSSACSSDEVAKWLAALRASGELLTASIGDSRTILVAGNQSGHVHQLKRRAYIKGFELVRRGDALVADPQIDVVDEGLMLTAKSERDVAAGKTAVDVELRMVVLDHPLRERTLRVVKHGAPVTVQSPTGLTWTLRTSDALAEDEALVLTGFVAASQGPAFVAVLRPRPSSTTVASAR